MGFETIGEAFVAIGCNLNPLKAGLAKGKDMLSGFAKNAGGILQNGLVQIGLAAGVGATIALAVKSFAEAEAAEQGLASAMEARGMAVDENMNRMKALADQIQMVTTVEGDSMLPIMQQGIAMGLSADQAMEAAKAAVGLSKAYGIDVKDAMVGVGKEMLGIESRLGKQIPALQGVEGATDRLNIISTEAAIGMEEQFAATDTTAGGFEQLKNTVGDLMESLGGLIAGPLSQMVTWLNNLIQVTVGFASTSDESFGGVGDSVGSMGDFMGGVFRTIGGWISTFEQTRFQE